MREDWPHLDILADRQALLGTDSRLKLIEAVLFDVRRRVEELQDSISSAGGRLDLVEETFTQQRQTGPTSLQPLVPGKNRFPSPPADGKDGNDVLHENVANLSDNFSDLSLSLEKECMKREQEIISVQRQLDGFRDSYKRLSESQKVQQSVMDSCLKRVELCEDMRASMQLLTHSESEMREHLEEVQHNIQKCLATQQTLNKDQIAPRDVSGCNPAKPVADVNPVLAGHVAKLSRDVSGVTDRLTSLELCMQGSALERQDSLASDKSVVNDVRRMQLAIATISRSVSKVAKDVFDMRASELASRSSTATSLGSILTQGSKSGQRPSIANFQASSAGAINRLAQKSPSVQTSSNAPPLTFRSPAIRSLGPNSNLAPAKEDVASDASTSVQSPSPPRSTHTDTLSISSRSKFALARASLSAVSKDSRSATLRAIAARSALTEPAPADRFALRSQRPARPSETLSKLVQREESGPVC